MTCKHTIGLILYPYEGYSPIKDGEPVFLSCGFEFSRRQFDRLDKEQNP